MRVPLPLTILAVIALATACGGGTPATASPGRTPTNAPTASTGATATPASTAGSTATAGGGGGGDNPENVSCNDGVVGSDVSIVDFAFEPAQQQADADDTVHWTNNGDQRHTVTFDNGKDCGTLESGESLTVLFRAPGTYSYFCDLHRTMTGTIEVGG